MEQLKAVAGILDDAVITLYRNNQPLETHDGRHRSSHDHPRTTKRSRFRFSMVGIKVGERITFAPTGEEVTVASDNEVERGGQRYKLSEFTRLFMPEGRRTPSNSYQGACYFTYNGLTLEKLRMAAEARAATGNREAQP